MTDIADAISPTFALRHLLAAATPGPWSLWMGHEDRMSGPRLVYVRGVIAGSHVLRFDGNYGLDESADAQLIVALRNQAGDLLDAKDRTAEMERFVKRVARLATDGTSSDVHWTIRQLGKEAQELLDNG